MQPLGTDRDGDPERAQGLDEAVDEVGEPTLVQPLGTDRHEDQERAQEIGEAADEDVELVPERHCSRPGRTDNGAPPPHMPGRNAGGEPDRAGPCAAMATARPFPPKAQRLSFLFFQKRANKKSQFVLAPIQICTVS